jgi:hypothetical protein
VLATPQWSIPSDKIPVPYIFYISKFKIRGIREIREISEIREVFP